MNDKIKKLLKGAGFSDDVITLLEKDDKDFDVQKAVEENNAAQKEHYKSLLENEIKETVKNEVIKERDGHLLGILNHSLKKVAGVPLADIQDLEISDKIKFAASHIKSETEKATGKSSEDFKMLQKENLDLKNKLSEKEDWLPKSEIENEKQKLHNERKAEKIDAHLQKEFTSIPADKILGSRHSEGIFLATNNIIKSKYDLDFEGDTPVFYEKGTKKKVTGKNSTGKDDFLKASDILTQELKALNFLVESNGQGGQGEPDKNTGAAGQSGKQKSQRLIELEKKIEAEAS